MMCAFPRTYSQTCGKPCGFVACLVAVTLAGAPSLAYALAPPQDRPNPALGENANGEPVRLVLLEPQISAELPDADKANLVDELAKSLQSPDYEVLDERPDAALAGCARPACDDSILRQGGATHVLAASLQGEGRVFDLELRLYEVGQTDPIAVATGRCDICGYTELVDLLRTKALSLQARLATGPAAPAVIAVMTDPPGAVVTLDGQPAGTTPLSLDVQPGRHRIEVRREGYFVQGREIIATRGVSERLELQLAPLPKHRIHPAWGGTTLALGLATAGVGGVLLGIHGRHYGPRCDRPMRFDEEGDCRYVYETRKSGIGLAVTGGVLALTGIVLLAVGRRPKPKAPNVAWQWLGNGLSGRF